MDITDLQTSGSQTGLLATDGNHCIRERQGRYWQDAYGFVSWLRSDPGWAPSIDDRWRSGHRWVVAVSPWSEGNGTDSVVRTAEHIYRNTACFSAGWLSGLHASPDQSRYRAGRSWRFIRGVDQRQRLVWRRFAFAANTCCPGLGPANLPQSGFGALQVSQESEYL